MKYILNIVTTALFLLGTTVFAQHERIHMPGDAGTSAMTHSFSLNLPANRNGSGTAWQPDSSPMYGYMLHLKKWMFMYHGNLFLRYNNQDITQKGSRGDAGFDAPNWIMGMGQRRIGDKGLFRFNTMFSLDPFTVGGRGYPLLFQTGETWEGKRLVDRQHPHNLFSELSVGYTQMINEDIDIISYLAFPGEPALGPVAFMHRVSALNNPDAPLSHHWQDATHITFGVATLGVRYKIFKLETSNFTGREPGEERLGFDQPRFDSYAYRLSVNPKVNWAMQVSHALIKSPERIEVYEDVRRITASLLHNNSFNAGKSNLTSAFIWGLNNHEEGPQEHSFTLESNLQLNKTAVYGRYEWVQKSPEELNLSRYENIEVFNINTLTLGFNYTILSRFNTNLIAGAQGSVFATDRILELNYGKNPLSAEVYIRITPGLMNMTGK